MNRIVHSTLRAGWGLALLGGPRRLLGLVGHPDADEAAVAVARVLGARHVGQALVTATAGRHEVVLSLGRAADGLHAASALLLAGVSPRWRGVGLLDGAVASSFALSTPR